MDTICWISMLYMRCQDWNVLQELDMQRIGDDVETGKSNPSTDTDDTPKLAGSTSQRLLITVRYQTSLYNAVFAYSVSPCNLSVEQRCPMVIDESPETSRVTLRFCCMTFRFYYRGAETQQIHITLEQMGKQAQALARNEWTKWLDWNWTWHMKRRPWTKIDW